MYGIIGTWSMATLGVKNAQPLLEKGDTAGNAVEEAITGIEDYPYFKSVGYGGLPNSAGELEMDSAFMDGDSFQIGAIAGVKDIANPIKVSRSLSTKRVNNFLVARGAEEYALEQGFTPKTMLTKRAQGMWEKRRQEVAKTGRLTPYDGHDTVCVIAVDQQNSMAVGTSTSGLFMKHPGRVGDSPQAGNGFYVDSEIGGVAATGLGEDMMKRPLCFETLQLMQAGYPVQEALNKAVYNFVDLLEKRNGQVGEFSYIALDKDGNYACATNVDFQFAVATAEEKPALYLAQPKNHHQVEVTQASEQWIADYYARIQK